MTIDKIDFEKRINGVINRINLIWQSTTFRSRMFTLAAALDELRVQEKWLKEIFEEIRLHPLCLCEFMGENCFANADFANIILSMKNACEPLHNDTPQYEVSSDAPTIITKELSCSNLNDIESDFCTLIKKNYDILGEIQNILVHPKGDILYKRELKMFLDSPFWNTEQKELDLELKKKICLENDDKTIDLLSQYRDSLISEFKKTSIYPAYLECYDNENGLDKCKLMEQLAQRYLRKSKNPLNVEELNELFLYEVAVDAINNKIQSIKKDAKHNKPFSTADFIAPEILENYIFNETILDSNDKLIEVRNEIARSIEMGEYAILYDAISNREKIDPNAKNEWYWILAAIDDAGLLRKKNATDANFVKQMVEWYVKAHIFDWDSPEKMSKELKKFRGSLSAERTKWKYKNKLTRLIDLKAKQNLLGQLDRNKINRIISIAKSGLYDSLIEMRNQWDN